MLCLCAQCLLSEKYLTQMNDWRPQHHRCQSSTPLGGIIRVQLGKKPCTLGSLQHSSPKKNTVGADFPNFLSVLQNFLVLLKVWSSLDLDFYSIFILLPGEFCGVWSQNTLVFRERESSARTGFQCHRISSTQFLAWSCCGNLFLWRKLILSPKRKFCL